MTRPGPGRREQDMNLNTVLIKPASSQCSMTCDYCFYCDEAAKREAPSYGMMSEETLKNIIKKILFQATGDVCFAFQGGEPTLRGLRFFEKAVEFEQRYNRGRPGYQTRFRQTASRSMSRGAGFSVNIISSLAFPWTAPGRHMTNAATQKAEPPPTTVSSELSGCWTASR